jgi:hypothetical protein
MPFTNALPEQPIFPSAQGKVINSDITPTQEYATLFSGLRNWISRVHGALGETGQTLHTVATLPTAVGKTGVRYMVSDANATTFNSVVAGGGANIVPVFSNGTTWRIG